MWFFSDADNRLSGVGNVNRVMGCENVVLEYVLFQSFIIFDRAFALLLLQWNTNWLIYNYPLRCNKRLAFKMRGKTKFVSVRLLTGWLSGCFSDGFPVGYLVTLPVVDGCLSGLFKHCLLQLVLVLGLWGLPTICSVWRWSTSDGRERVRFEVSRMLPRLRSFRRTSSIRMCMRSWDNVCCSSESPKYVGIPTIRVKR